MVYTCKYTMVTIVVNNLVLVKQQKHPQAIHVAISETRKYFSSKCSSYFLTVILSFAEGRVVEDNSFLYVSFPLLMNIFEGAEFVLDLSTGYTPDPAMP